MFSWLIYDTHYATRDLVIGSKLHVNDLSHSVTTPLYYCYNTLYVLDSPWVAIKYIKLIRNIGHKISIAIKFQNRGKMVPTSMHN